MSETNFAFILLLLSLAYGFKSKITKIINQIFFKNYDNFELKSKYISYLLFIILIFVLVFGMMLGTKTEKTYGNVSEGFKKVRTKGEDRPNPLFDIDTYW